MGRFRGVSIARYISCRFSAGKKQPPLLGFHDNPPTILKKLGPWAVHEKNWDLDLGFAVVVAAAVAAAGRTGARQRSAGQGSR